MDETAIDQLTLIDKKQEQEVILARLGGEDIEEELEPTCTVGLENLSNSRRASLNEFSWKKWEQTLEKIVPAIVALRVNMVRSFDTERSSSTQATGFIVDAKRGIILTNRHVISPGPIIAEAIFYDHEEVPIRPIYRDPVHDFGFAQFDPTKVRYMKMVDVPLRPDLAKIGLDIRVIGNDAGEKLSILAGTLARLDRKAPFYGVGKYNDFDTFYYQAASGTSGGSSGSPVIDINGNTIALNAAGKRKAASSYYLPLDRVERALRLLQEGKLVSRGTLQVAFKHQPYDEVRRLGLRTETEDLVRKAFPQDTGLLTVEQVLPKGPADGLLESGDILVRINGHVISKFVPLEAALDDNVGKEVVVDIERGGTLMTLRIKVQDLHSITPNRYVEISGGILNELSYQMAKSYSIPVGGVYVASAGYMFNLAGLLRNAIIVAVDNNPTPNMEAFLKVISQIPDGKRMPVRFINLSDIHRERLTIVPIDMKWHPFRSAIRDDVAGIWRYNELSYSKNSYELTPSTVSFISMDGPMVKFEKLISSLVIVEFHSPFSIDGVPSNNLGGAGLIVDAEKGLIVVDRNTVPISLGDIYITFAGSLVVHGKLAYLHPYHNYAVITYDPKLLAETEIFPVKFSNTRLNTGEEVMMVGLTKTHQPIFRNTVVTNRRELCVRECNPPRFRAINLEGIEISNPLTCVGGVLCDKDGAIQGLWFSFSYQTGEAEDSQFFMGVDVDILRPVIEPLRQGKSPNLRSLCVELAEVPIAEARALGLSNDWVHKLELNRSARRNVLGVRRAFANSEAAKLLREGDIILEANGILATHLRSLDCDMYSPSVYLRILRDSKEIELDVPTMPISGYGTTRVVGWLGALLQDAHLAVAMQRKEIPEGVYSSWWSNGSPAHMYGLRATVWIMEVNGIRIKNLDDLLQVVDKLPSDTYIRIKTVDFNNKPSVLSLKTDYHYWPTWELRLDASAPHHWEWRRTSDSKKSV